MLLLTASLASAACADHVLEPVPGERAPAVPGVPARAFVSPVSDAVLSAPALGIPGSNAVLFGATAWTDLPADFGDAQWVELRTTGEVSWTINGAAGEAAKHWNCYGSNAFPYYGEGSSGGGGLASGGLRVAATVAGSKPAEDDYGAVMESEGGQVYRLARVWPGARLYGRRTGLGGVCNGVPWYFFQGQHRVEVRKVTPVQVKPDKESFNAGEVLTWTTELYRDLTRLTWTFERTDGTIEYPGCSTKSCAYAPRGPGIMKVSARWERASPTVYVEGYSPPVTNQPAKIKLTCTGDRGENSVTRGQTINCIASKDPVDAPGELKVSEWTFLDNDGHNIAGPAGSSVLSWSGIMVVGGTVRAVGTMDGNQAAGTATIQVSPRTDWRIEFPAAPAPARSEVLPYPPITPPGGKADGVFGRHTYSWAEPRLRGGTGPNRGWYFFRSPPEFREPRIHINPGLYPDDPFYRAQNGGTSSSGRRYCDRRFMESARSLVEEHEIQHHTIASQFWTGAGVNLVEAARYYHPEGTLSADSVSALMSSASSDTLRARQAAFDNVSKLAIPCELKPLSTR